jgi:hypothetical protein
MRHQSERETSGARLCIEIDLAQLKAFREDSQINILGTLIVETDLPPTAKGATINYFPARTVESRIPDGKTTSSCIHTSRAANNDESVPTHGRDDFAIAHPLHLRCLGWPGRPLWPSRPLWPGRSLLPLLPRRTGLVPTDFGILRGLALPVEPVRVKPGPF